MNIKNKQYFNKINTELNKLNLSNNPKELYEPIKYILKMKSKKIRPILSILAYKLKKNKMHNAIYDCQNVLKTFKKIKFIL